MSTCQTCQKPIVDGSKFCPKCGAQQIANRLTLSNLVGKIFTKLSNLDSSLFRTTKWLLVNPAKVTIGYIQGVRKVISSPVSYSFILLSIYGIFQYLFSDFLDQTTKVNFLSGIIDGISSSSKAKEGGVFGKEVVAVLNWLQSRNQLFIFALIPLMSLLSALFYRKKAYHLAEHLVISIYAVSFTLILSVLLGLLLAPFSSELAGNIYLQASLYLNIIAIVWIFQKSYGGSYFKPILVAFLSFIVMILLVIAVLVVTIRS